MYSIPDGYPNERPLRDVWLATRGDVTADGHVTIGAGSTLVRHSDPDSEVAETEAKAAALLAALGSADQRRLCDDTRVRAALAERNATIANFWLAPEEARACQPDALLTGRKVLVVDAEDNFTSMLDHQLRSLGLSVVVRRFDEPYSFDGFDVVVMGPGPGDPNEVSDPRIAHLRRAITTLLSEGRPFLAVCLSHQVLSTLLGLTLARRDVPNQGVQREIELFGATELVGFYNTFAARSTAAVLDCDGVGPVEVSSDRRTGEVHALRGRGFASLQFHAESLLTKDGVRIIGALMKEVLDVEGNHRLVGS